jgi:hypothetical protein
MNNSECVPSNEQVRLIYKDTYNYYTKWIAVKDPDWSEVMAEAHRLEAKYPFGLCRKILVELVSVIEASYMKRSENNGA